MPTKSSIQILGDEISRLHVLLSNKDKAIEIHNQRIYIGYIDSISTTHLPKESLLKYHKNVFSQVGQDGILEEIFLRLNIKCGTFIEFGGWDGIYLSNCRYLALQGWKGLFIEAARDKFQELCCNYQANKKIICINKFVEFCGVNSIDNIVESHELNNVDFLCIDIDGLDYKIIETMKLRPKVILVEGGGVLSPYMNKRIPDEIAQNNVSQPLPVLLSIATNIGYSVVCYFQDLYLVREDIAAKFPRYNESPIELYKEAYLSLSDFSKEYNMKYRNSNPAIREIEILYFGKYESNPLAYLPK
ncbi:MAG: FkbM family methyltransferase [Pelosinus sp.]|nr:FkbM family methyltransferase [Pelosinus sp.]